MSSNSDKNENSDSAPAPIVQSAAPAPKLATSQASASAGSDDADVDVVRGFDPRARWYKPNGTSSRRPLMVQNTLTGQKDEFITIDEEQKRVTWYICGPTVYDSSHIGHARSFMTFDIIRRVLEEYFGYEVFYVMNITDVDDKIILRARRNYLVKQYVKEVTEKEAPMAELVRDAETAFSVRLPKMEATIADLEARLPSCPAKDRKDLEARIKSERVKLGNVTEARVRAEELLAAKGASVTAASQPAEVRALVDEYVAIVQDVLASYLDDLKGAEVDDPSIFREHAAKFELEFMEDMRALGVRDATVLTRVTEYVPQIVAYVQKIIDNGYAYESGGSVYFDTRRFDEDHMYVKLAPDKKDNEDLAEEGEGAIGSSKSDKKCPADFALWKKSKAGEPSWESPWGPGRPGWHIECSVMASDHLGHNFDVHSGGEDLTFPHHDNELAQAEAHYSHHQWVNYFFHAGHLHIKGLKMSKSLKNFITIRTMLKHHTARQVRILFLSSEWDKTINYSDSALLEAVSTEKTFSEFLLNLKADLRGKPPVVPGPLFWHEEERALHAAFLSTQQGVHEALCDNFNTPRVMELLLSIVTAANTYRANRGPDAQQAQLLTTIADYVVKMLGVFGVEFAGVSTSASSDPAGGANREAVITPFMEKFMSFRTALRKIAIGDDNLSGVLELCDRVRTDDLIDLGIRIEDDGENSIWKLDDPDKLRLERRQRREKDLAKVERQLINRKKDFGRKHQAAVEPLVRLEAEGFGGFEDGTPTLKNGEPITKGAKKKFTKTLAKYQKAYKKHLAELEQNPNYLQDLESEIHALEARRDELEAAIEAEDAN